MRIFGGHRGRGGESNRRQRLYDMRRHTGAMRGARHVRLRFARQPDEEIRRDRVRSLDDDCPESWREGVPRLPSCRKRGAVQRFRPAGLWHGLVCASDRVRSQRRQPDTNGSSARDGRNPGRAESGGERRRDSVGDRRREPDGDGLVHGGDPRGSDRSFQPGLSGQRRAATR